MTPYYDHAGITIYHGDCRDVLPSLTFDSIVADAPYAIGVGYENYADTDAALVEVIDGVAPYLVAGGAHAVFCGTRNIWRWPEPTWTLCWVEPSGLGVGRWGFACWQPILAYGADPYLARGMGSRPDILRCRAASASNLATTEGASGHPVPKPLAVMSWTLERVAMPGAVICDPFVGSGTTLVAAKARGHAAIGIDLSERYCEIAAKRLAQEVLAL